MSSGITITEIDKHFTDAENLLFGRNGVAQDSQKASKIYLQCAEMGHARAMTVTALLYRYGAGFDHVSESEYKKWIRRAADAGDRLGEAYCYLDGIGVHEDHYRSFTLGKQVAEEGIDDAIAMNFVGCRYNYGQGVERDYEQSLSWYKRSAELRFSLGFHNLAICYYNGEAVEKDYTEAVRLYLLSIDHGSAGGLCNLGVCYSNGNGVEKDYVKACELFRRAAVVGLATAQNNLGWRYNRGQGVEQDSELAFYWWKRAADQGDAAGQLNVGICFYNGTGVDRDYSQAFSWWKLAADQGDAAALYNVGLCHYYGLGTELDVVKSVECFFLSYAKDSDEFKDALAEECLHKIAAQDRVLAAEWAWKFIDIIDLSLSGMAYKGDLEEGASEGNGKDFFKKASLIFWNETLPPLRFLAARAVLSSVEDGLECVRDTYHEGIVNEVELVKRSLAVMPEQDSQISTLGVG